MAPTPLLRVVVACVVGVSAATAAPGVAAVRVDAATAIATQDCRGGACPRPPLGLEDDNTELLQLHAPARSWEEGAAGQRGTGGTPNQGSQEVIPLRKRVRGWLDYVTRLEGNFPLNVTDETEPLNCQVGNCRGGKCRPDFYIGGRFKTLPTSALQGGSAIAGTSHGVGRPDVDRVCQVGKGVKHIVSPIINIVGWLCGNGTQGITTESEEKLLQINEIFFPALLNMTYRVKLDGDEVLSDMDGKAAQQDILYLTEKRADLFRVGPPDYNKTTSAGIPDFETLQSCSDKKVRENQKVLGSSVGYYFAVPASSRVRTLEYAARLVDLNLVPPLDFSLSVRYNFTYAE